MRIGYNSRLDTVQAARLLPKLDAFRKYELKDRNVAAEKYTEALKDIYVTPLVPEGFESSWAQYTLILESAEQRDRIQSALKEKGIPTMIYYPIPMHKQTAFKGYDFNLEDLKVAESLCDRVMSIPMHPYLDDETINTVTEALRSCR